MSKRGIDGASQVLMKVVSFLTFPCGTTPLFVGAYVGVITELWYARNVVYLPEGEFYQMTWTWLGEFNIIV